MKEKRRRVTRGRLTKSSCIHKSKDETTDIKSKYFFNLGIYPNPVRSGSYEDIAINIFTSSEFSRVFSEDGSVFGDHVDHLIETVVDNYTNYSKNSRDRMVTMIRSILRTLVSELDKDSDQYDTYVDRILGEVYMDTHDLSGMVY